MLITNHVLSGAVIGAVVGRPLPALGLGIASHFGLDMVPHWGTHDHESFAAVARRDGLTGLAAIAVLAAAARPRWRWPVLAGIVGAVLPDLDKPGRKFLGHSPYPEVVDEAHAEVQHESDGRMPQELGLAAGLGVLALTLARRPR